MTDRLILPPLYAALDRVEALHRRAEEAGMLGARLAADMADVEGQLSTAAGFAVRTGCPLAERAVPELTGNVPARVEAARAALRSIPLQDFDGWEERRVRHRAGFADLDQPGREFLLLYGLPNLQFHIAMAYGALRANGVPLGKADFDGLHVYPEGFRFAR